MDRIKIQLSGSLSENDIFIFLSIYISISKVDTWFLVFNIKFPEKFLWLLRLSLRRNTKYVLI